MRKIPAFFLCAMVLCAAATARADEFLTYRDVTRGIQLDYPSDWSSMVRGDVIGFVSPVEHNTETFLANVNVVVLKIREAPQTPAEFRKLAEKQIYAHFPQAVIRGFSETHLSGFPAYQILFTAREGFSNLLYCQVYALAGQKCYFLTFAADLYASDEDFRANLRNAKAIFNSFQITDFQ